MALFGVFIRFSVPIAIATSLPSKGHDPTRATPHPSTSTMASISTGTLSGSALVPTADRACLPRSPSAWSWWGGGLQGKGGRYASSQCQGCV